MLPQLVRSQQKRELYHQLWMDMAWRASLMSHSVKRRVGAVLVKDGDPISIGWNGMPSGLPNACERWDDALQKYVTLDGVLHAEENIVRKMARSASSSTGATLYITYAPCDKCARLIWGMGVAQVYYDQSDTNPDEPGVTLLRALDVPVSQFQSCNAAMIDSLKPYNRTIA